MGGQDKGWVTLAGRPLIAHVLDALRPQVDTLLINANRSIERYRALGCPVIGDALDDFQGPLSGFASALEAAETPLVVVVPCDGPRLPTDLVSRLRGALLAAGAEIAVAHDGERMQPVHALLRRDLCADLLAALEEGERKVDSWYARHATVSVDFSDHPEGFRNVNAEVDRQALEQEILADGPS
jgi:molybdopterin-guanine dinucleotide biosynthesis protein A